MLPATKALVAKTEIKFKASRWDRNIERPILKCNMAALHTYSKQQQQCTHSTERQYKKKRLNPHSPCLHAVGINHPCDWAAIMDQGWYFKYIRAADLCGTWEGRRVQTRRKTKKKILMLRSRDWLLAHLLIGPSCGLSPCSPVATLFLVSHLFFCRRRRYAVHAFARNIIFF